MKQQIHVVIMGVSGSGKTTIAGILQDRWGWGFAEADDFHPQRNIAKMQSGVPLTDDDRWPWLESIREWMTAQEAEGHSTIITCSALKRSYRDVLRQGSNDVIFVHLHGDKALLEHRLAARTNHFMPSSLLKSQFATLEPLESDEIGVTVDIAGTPSDIATNIEVELARISHVGLDSHSRRPASDVSKPVVAGAELSSASPAEHEAIAQVGVYGLGVMGSALARNVARHGFHTAVTNIDYSQTRQFIAQFHDEGTFVPAESIAEFVGLLERPRKILLMVTAGDPVDAVLGQLIPYLESGDIVVDMGNSHFSDTRRRDVELRQRGIYFVGCGTSGGEDGALHGPALMIGGSPEAYEQLEPIFTEIAARTGSGISCANFVGTDGSGHLVKTLHNGIEYADMEVLAEIYHVLLNSQGASNQDVSRLFDEWNKDLLSSYLLEISSDILTYSEEGTDFIEKISDRAGQKGTGAWSSIVGIENGVDISMLSASLFARLSSVSTLRDQWNSACFERGRDDSITCGGVEKTEGAPPLAKSDFRHALLLSKLVAYTQGLSVIAATSEKYHWDINLSDVCRGWRAGCIIRGAVLDEFSRILESDNDPSAIIMQNISLIEQCIDSLRRVIAVATTSRIPVPALSAALTYVDTIRARRLPTALIQAQRDYFGAHGFSRTDRGGSGFHGPWNSGYAK